MVIDWKARCSKELNSPQIDLQSESKSNQVRWLFVLFCCCFITHGMHIEINKQSPNVYGPAGCQIWSRQP